MATMKEYGLIFEDLSVKVAEVVVDRSSYESICSNGLKNELWNELQSFLRKNKYNPIAILPDTAYYGCNNKETIIRDATVIERKEYLLAYEELQEYLMDFPEEKTTFNELDILIQNAGITLQEQSEKNQCRTK